jgi:FMN phosphatase YigB (HAD superfamily)
VFIDDLEANVAGARLLGWHGIVYTGTADLRRRLGDLGVAV